MRFYVTLARSWALSKFTIAVLEASVSSGALVFFSSFQCNLLLSYWSPVDVVARSWEGNHNLMIKSQCLVCLTLWAVPFRSVSLFLFLPLGETGRL